MSTDMDTREKENNNEVEEYSDNTEDFSVEDGDNASLDPELETMFKAGVHFGYSRSRRHPKMQPYIFGLRHNIEVFNLIKVRTKLSEALAYIADLAKKNKTILFVGTKPSLRDVIETYARKINQPFMNVRWIGGILTNFSVIRGRMDYYENIKKDQVSGDLVKKYTKKELLMLGKELKRLEHNFQGVISLKKLPDALFIIDPKEEQTALHEAKKMRIPVIAVANTDVDPLEILHLIPANDSARTSIDYLLRRVTETWNENKGGPSQE